MAYYPIKCPYCLLELSNKDVRFNLRTGTLFRSRDIQENEVRVNEPVDEFGFGDDFLGTRFSDDYDDVPDYLRDVNNSGQLGSDGGKNKYSQRNETPTEGFYTYAQLQTHFGESNVEPILHAHIYAPPALASKPEYREELLVGVKITERKDGKAVTTQYMRRFCECEKELMASAGMKVSKVLLMLGPTSSGKTMFIIALHKTLKKEGGYILPPRGTGAKGIAKLLVTVLSGGSAGDTSLKQMSDDLYMDGKLPLSTFNFDNEPLVLDVSVDFITGKSSNALLFLRDVPGESMTNAQRTETLDVIAGQFPLFDGFIMMLDPFTFEWRSVFSHDGSADTTSAGKMTFIENLDEVLAGKISTYFGGKKIDRPTAVIVTKSDHFFNRENAHRLESAGVKRSFPSLTKYQKASFDKQYFGEVDYDVIRIISALSPNIVKMLEKNFNNIFLGLASALSKTPLAIEDRQDGTKGHGHYIVNPTAIHPWRVADPFIRMLMKLNIVPPFDECDIRKPDLESADSLKARNSRFISEVNKWGRMYCNAWTEIAGMHLEEYDPVEMDVEYHKQQATPKTGLFGKLFGI